MVATLVSPAAAGTSRTPAPRALPSRRGPPLSVTLLPLAFHAVAVILLGISGYPAPRIAVVAGAAMAPRLLMAWLSRRKGGPSHEPKTCHNADAELNAWWVAGSKSTFLLSFGLTVAATGGVASPLLATMIVPYVWAVAVAGDRVQTRLLLAATGLVVGLIALLPASWTGPRLGEPAYSVLLVASVVGLGALLAPVHAWARQRQADFHRAREEVATEALARAQSLEQIGSKLAHELKNPLTGIKALVQLGLMNPAEASSHARLAVVEREAARMQEILQNHLSFTRPLQAVMPLRFDLGPLVSDALGALAARADAAGVRLYAQGDAAIDADPRRLREALLNLLANAIEATPPGGSVDVDVRPGADEAEIVIRDTGRGMPAETLRRIGTPFFTTRDDGTGLGVVLARSVIAQHGGSMTYESEPGRGTQVRVALPRRPREGCDVARAARG